MIKNTFLALLILSTSLLSQAGTISLGASNQIDSFNQHLAQNPQKKSLINTLITRKLNASEKEILGKHSLAVKGLLLEDLTPSIYLFKELTIFKNNKIFSKEISSYISESYYRLSNLERLKTNFWIKEGLFFNPNYKPSSRIFNPDIIKHYTVKSLEIKNYSFLYKKINLFDSDTHLFINGVPINDNINLHPSGQYYLKLFKHGYEEASFNFSGEYFIKQKKVTWKKLKLGTCKKPNFITYQGIKIDEIFFSKNCIKKISNQPVLAKDKSPFKSSKITLNTSSSLNTEPKLFQKKSTWYMLAGVVVASVIIFSLSTRNSEITIEPVQH